MSYPDPVAAVVAYLNQRASDSFADWRAFGGVPNPRPARFARVQWVGTTVRSVAHRDCRVLVESWAPSQAQARADADQVAEWLADMATFDGVVPQGPDGWFGGPYDQPDPDSLTPRTVQTVNLRQGKS